MKIKNLQIKRAARAVLIGLLLNVAGVTKGYAYDFSAVCETGQTLYYKIINASNHYIELTRPGGGGFDGWSGFTKPIGDIILPESVQYDGVVYTVTLIGYRAFYNCSGLTGNLIIPNSVTEIGEAAFNNCSGFTGGLTIPNSVTEIGSSAFCNCSGFTGGLTIPNSVTEIGSSAFYNCSGFTGNLVIPNSVTSIGSQAFHNCSGFTGNLTIPNSVTYLSGFGNCTGLTGELVIPNSVTEIDGYAFYNCSGFTGSLTIPNSVTKIGGYAFYNCSGFTGGLTISNSVTTIGGSAFAECNGFTGSLTIPNSVTEIGWYAFQNCSGFTGSLTIPNSLTKISPLVFYYCSGLTGNLTIPNSVTEIGYCAFEGCSGLSGTLTIGNSVTKIGELAFSECSGFTGTLTIPNSVTTIDLNAFYKCTGFTGNLIIPNSVTTLVAPFTYCSGIETIEVETGNAFYDSRNNCNAIINTATNELVNGCKNTIIPSSVTKIGVSAFNGCTGLTSVAIPNCVTMIDQAAFHSCTSLTSIVIPNSVTSIGYNAFNNSAISILTLLPTTPPTLSSISLDGMTNLQTIYVPYESINSYKTANYWSTYESKMLPMVYKTISAHGTNENLSGWNFISSPLVADTTPTAIDSMIAATANNYDLYRFNQSAELEWENWKNDDEVLNHYQFDIENGQGYLYANAEDVNLIFKGAFNEDATKGVELVYDANADLPGWNLVGNPFPVNAYTNKSYYRMNDDGSAIYPTAVSTSTAIAPCTGIMVKAETTGESVTFSKTTTSGQPANNGLLHIAVANANTRGTSVGSAALDKAIVSFNEGNALEKFVFNRNNAQLYIPQNGKDYAIAFSEGQGEMPLNFKATKDGTYTLSINPEGVEMSYLHLIDNMTGADVDLLVPEPVERPTTYTFNAKTTDYESRFKLVFSANNANNEDGVSTSSTTFAFFSDENWIINNEGEATLQVVDVMGHVISSENINGSVSKAINAVPGVYMIRLINGNDVKTQKIVVK